MRFMMMVKSNAESEAGTPPSPALMAAVGELTMEMMKAGVVVDTGGLMPSSSGAKIRIGAGGLKVVDGPFSEAKEVIGGYAILRADSREEAIELGRRFMQVHQDVLGPTYEGELEIRQLTEFGPPR
jgi:hypothetical protein